MKRKYIFLALAIAMLMTGCGKIEDTDDTSGKSGAAVSPPSDAADTFLGSKPQTDTASQQEKKSLQQTVVSSETESETDSEAGQETHDPGNDGDKNALSPENISGYQFGFELYDDGHKDCWEQRYECAKLMLEAIAQPGAENTATDHVPDSAELNDKETDGFQTWLKFENDMTFRVGDTFMSGNMLRIVDFNGAYYFFIGEIEEISGMMEFDSRYIPKILAAAGAAPAETQTVVENADPEEIDLSTTNMVITASQKKYSSLEGSENHITADQIKHIVYAVLDIVSGSMTEAPGRTITEQAADNDPSGVFMLFDFGKPTSVNICGSEREIYVISMGGNSSDGYLININNEKVYDIDENIVRGIIDIISTE